MSETIIPTFASVARQVWYWTVIRGVLAIVFGLVALFAPISTLVTLAVVIAVFAIVDGFFEIVDGIRHRSAGGARLRVLQGVLTLAFGIVLVVWPSITALAIVWTIGVWAVVVGVIQVVVAISLRTVARSGWAWGVVSGLLSVIFGVIVAARPAAGLVSIVWLVGVYALMLGVLLVGFGLQVRRLATTVTEIETVTETETETVAETAAAPTRVSTSSVTGGPAAHAAPAGAHRAPGDPEESESDDRPSTHVASHLQAPGAQDVSDHAPDPQDVSDQAPGAQDVSHPAPGAQDVSDQASDPAR